MPKGNISGASARVKAKSGGSFGPEFLRFNLADGEAAVVRFLVNEEDFDWAWCHRLPPRPNMRWGDLEPCLDQDGDGSRSCPGCERGWDRMFNGWIPLLWKLVPPEEAARISETQLSDRFKLVQPPKYGSKEIKRKDGTPLQVIDWKSIVGNQEDIFVFSKGIRMFEELAGKDSTFRKLGGLPFVDFVIKREGKTGDDTKWHLDPLLNDKLEISKGPLTDEQTKLFEEFKKRVNLMELTTPKSYDTFMAKIMGSPMPQADNDDMADPVDPMSTVVDVSAFAAEKG